MEGVYELKSLTLIWQSNQDGTLQVWTDLPAPWGVKRTYAIPNSNGLRAQKTFNFDMDPVTLAPLPPLQGTMWKPRITPGATGYLIPFQVSYILKRRYGEYLYGPAGDYWETQPLDLGV